MRLNRYIASCGICSRRKADELIKDGHVFVNGKKILEVGISVETKDVVCVDNKVLKPQKLEYYRFYKPVGYITSADDEKGRKVIYDILPKEMASMKPVGRLDKDSKGLLILTNDGDLINKLTHPSKKIPKVYIVTVDGRVTLQHQQEMAKGMEIEEGKLAYADSQIFESSSSSTTLKIVLYQGLNRQIRKMFEKLGFVVTSLKRIQHANISIEGLKRGQFKQLKPQQVKELKTYLKNIDKDNN